MEKGKTKLAEVRAEEYKEMIEHLRMKILSGHGVSCRFELHLLEEALRSLTEDISSTNPEP